MSSTRSRSSPDAAIMFSQRMPGELVANRLSVAVAELKAQGKAVIDLTQSNPTQAGFAYSPGLLAPLASANALTYQPAPFGLPAARQGAADEYARRGVEIAADRIVLTASTSDAYGLLFKLLADPGDEILAPRPSYPVFDHLIRRDALVARPYDMGYHGAWSIDFTSIDAALSPRTRAVLIVSPNNPTGSYVKQDELDRLAAVCGRRGIALVADEVFADYPLDARAAGAAGCML